MRPVILFKLKNNCKGSTSVIIICSILVTIVVSAFLADILYAAYETYKLSKTADNVVLLGAQSAINNRIVAEEAMKSVAVKEIYDLNELKISVSSDGREISVMLGKPFSYLFIKVFGFNDKQLSAKSAAKLSNISSLKGLRPLAVEKQRFSFDKDTALTLRKPGLPGKTAFNTLALGDGDFESNILFGYRNTVNALNGVYTSGESVESIKSSLKLFINRAKKESKGSATVSIKDNPNIICIPVVDKLEINQGSQMKICGFAAYQVKNVSNEGEELIIEGRFIKGILETNTNDAVEDFGLSGIRLFR